ncbi:hypothetical protein [Natronosalvus rutilus]|uniref:Uncharacterized protein n=1 Tax=Natronosalvus rutilus TaxID=2953753 RepID=A0A9E7N8N8_9EURY|nr:hypothetical protein [Natronosalvus rutilus]UTF52433.1 hypothetical protein NGM29_11600 [Natronosalvus rutilus]
MASTDEGRSIPAANCSPEEWWAYVEAVELEQVETAYRTFEQCGTLTAAQRRVIEELATTLVVGLAPAAGSICCEGSFTSDE